MFSVRRKIRSFLGDPRKHRTSTEKFLSWSVPLTGFIVTVFFFILLGNAQASIGGLSVETSFQKARLVNGKAIPPKNAPLRVKSVIRSANEIRKKPYVYGGGHGSFLSHGYDCSGAVSYALRGGRFLKSPIPSGSLMNWGHNGKGKWITVYANAGHAYMIVAGLRFDTANTVGNGPRWSKRHFSIPGSFTKRHPRGY